MFRMPDTVVVEQDSPGWFVASCQQLDCYGEGPTEAEACADLIGAMTADYLLWQTVPYSDAVNAGENVAALLQFATDEEAPVGNQSGGGNPSQASLTRETEGRVSVVAKHAGTPGFGA
jgi:hypothetical protein